MSAEDRVKSLMAAIEASVAESKKAREAIRQARADNPTACQTCDGTGEVIDDFGGGCPDCEGTGQ